MSFDTPEGLVWVVIESSAAGDTTIGVFTTMSQAREKVNELAGDRLESYRIEGHAIDQPKSEPLPWHVTMSREGALESVNLFIGCSCQDDEEEYYKRSFIAEGGETLYVIAFAVTPGQAIEVANDYRVWLQENGHWGPDERRLTPIHARTKIEPVALN